MVNRFRLRTTKPLLVAMSAVLMSSQAMATDGMFALAQGQAHKAMGGAGTAVANSPMSMANNPALAADVKNGYEVGADIFMPDRVAKFAMTGEVFDGNGEDMFVIPEFAYKKALSDKTSVGIAVYGNGGMNTTYKKSPAFPTPTGMTDFAASSGKTSGINLEQMFISPTVSRKLNDKHTVGVSANLVYQRFEAKGLDLFGGYSAAPTKLTDNGLDDATGIGLTVGWQGALSDKLRLGATYRTKTDMSKFDKYKGLFAEAGDLDVPAAATLGLAYQATPKTMLAMDYKHIAYSDVAAIGNEAAMVTGAIGKTTGFGWDDMDIIKLGVKHQYRPSLALMAGYSQGDSPIKGEDTNFNVLAPGVIEQHVTLGFEKQLSKHSKLTGSYVHALENEVKADAAVMQMHDIKMKQDSLGLSYTREF